MNGRAESWHTKAESNLVGREDRLYTIVLVARKVEVERFDTLNTKRKK
jgi:hypothetical protein